MKYILIYWIASSLEEARSLAKELVRDRLVACANIASPIESIYLWEGKEEQVKEVQVFFKTRASSFERVQQYIVQHSHYAVPAILQIPVERGYLPYLEWLESSTVG